MNLPPAARVCILAVATAAIAACDQTPSEPHTVQLAMVAGAAHGGAPFRMPMSQELTTTVTGDPDGMGFATVTINVGQREACWDLSASNIALPATSSHIHRAAAGLSGPIVIALSPPKASGVAVGCASNLDRDLLQDILVNSASYYVNVHTSAFPAGAIRGQLTDQEK